jgi:thiol-disulfide isomerase/thioredoxin
MKKVLYIILPVLIFLSCENKKWNDASSMEKVEQPQTQPPSSGLPKVIGVAPNGDTLSIEKVPADYILLDFWASWCGPCRANHPGLVSVYSKYQGKGIEFFSVSLDQNKEKWVAAIAKDHLAWKYQICDFGGWDSPIAMQFGINQIPNNILFDKNGQILGQNMEPNDLDAMFSKLLEAKKLDSIVSH